MFGLSPALADRYPGQRQDEATRVIENRWRNYFPDLGGYLSPDPEHQAGVRDFVGSQAYAYAAGRPLLYSDPTGRRIGTAPAEARTVVAWASDLGGQGVTGGSVGDLLRQLVTDPDVTVNISNVAAAFAIDGVQIANAFGGITKSDGSGKSCSEINIYCNAQIWRTSNGNTFTQIPIDQNTYENLLVHELGHAWYRRNEATSGGVGDGVFSNVEAMLWENTARRARGGAARPYHP